MTFLVHLEPLQSDKQFYTRTLHWMLDHSTKWINEGNSNNNNNKEHIPNCFVRVFCYCIDISLNWVRKRWKRTLSRSLNGIWCAFHLTLNFLIPNYCYCFGCHCFVDVHDIFISIFYLVRTFLLLSCGPHLTVWLVSSWSHFNCFARSLPLLLCVPFFRNDQRNKERKGIIIIVFN